MTNRPARTRLEDLKQASRIIWEVATRNVPDTEPLVADMLERLARDRSV